MSHSFALFEKNIFRFEIVALFFNLEIDVMLWSQYLSFALVGVLVVSSTRSLLINLTKLFHFFASAGSSHLVLLFMSQVMGTYFVSLVIMMRMNMPEQYVVASRPLCHLFVITIFIRRGFTRLLDTYL